MVLDVFVLGHILGITICSSESSNLLLIGQALVGFTVDNLSSKLPCILAGGLMILF